MSINFIPNDPLAVADVPLRVQDPRPNRPAIRAGFNFSDAVPEKVYEIDTEDFLFWQCREAVLAAVETWEGLNGNLMQWARTGKKLDLSQKFEDPEFTGSRKLNAFYDGEGLRFFVFDAGTRNVMSGISTDTVSHETGHALLDTLRSELFGSNLPEPAAFHEAFADCMAILTALNDKTSRGALLVRSPNLDTPNFVESGSEYLSDAIQRQFGNVAPSKPRRALNDFQWKLPSTLPAGQFNDPPELLSREPHSFSRVFTGCFYDTLRNIFAGMPSHNEASLLQAAQTTGKLLIAGVLASPQTGRYFRAVGRAMVLADGQQNGGANRDAIGRAFSAHGLGLGSAATLFPTAALAGPPPTVLKDSARLGATTSRDLRERIQADAKLGVNALQMFGERVAEVVHQREVGLGQIDKRLAGVVAYAAETVLVGGSGPRAAVLGALPEPNQTVDEVKAFVETLLANGRIALGTKRVRGAAAAAAPAEQPQAVTHVIRTRGGKKILERIRFFCGAG
jgi:hypothetical protein